MRRLLPKWQIPEWQGVHDRKVQAIACVCAIVFLGIVFKPAPKSNADSLDTIPNQPENRQATSTARNLQRQEQIRQIRPTNYDLDRFPITPANEHHWRHLLWTTAVVEPEEPFVAEALNHILSLTLRKGLSDSQTRTVDMAMKVATQLYLSHPSLYGLVGQRFLDTIEQSADPEWVAVSLSGLAKGGMSVSELQRLGNRAKTRFPNWSNNLFLKTTLQDIADLSNPQDFPPLKDLLNWELAAQQLHLYVFCRPDRRILCRAILKDRNGDFVQQDGTFWSVSLLLESIHGLGWNFTRGQTPQGILRIEGMLSQPDDQFFRAYGQFPLVKLFVPFEGEAKAFLPGQAGAFTGRLETYQALLPPSWRGYRPMHQSYWAGKTGRGLFRIHGSGESPDFFSGKDKNYPNSYNWNPTIGCLSARELYTEKGQLIQADMPKLLNALKMVGGDNFAGYLIVVDVPTDGKPANMKEPVSLQTLEGAIASNAAKPRSSLQNSPQIKFNPKVSKQSNQPSNLTRSQPLKLATQSSPPNQSRLAPAQTLSKESRRLLTHSLNSIRDTGKHLNSLVISLDQLPNSQTAKSTNGLEKSSKGEKSPDDGEPMPIAY